MRNTTPHRSAWTLLLLLLVSLQASALACGIRCEAMTLPKAAAPPAMPACAMPSMQTRAKEHSSGARPVSGCDRICHDSWRIIQTRAAHAPQAHWRALLVLPVLHTPAVRTVINDARMQTRQRSHPPLTFLQPQVIQLRI